MFEQIHTFLSTTPFYDWRIILILISVGTFVGFINTIAGLATALSYGLFMLLGLPINVANGTTRVGILAQFITTSFIFKKEGYLDTGKGWRVGGLLAIGAGIGAMLAAILSTSVIEIVMALILPIMSIFLFIDKDKVRNFFSRGEQSSEGGATDKFNWWKSLIFCGIGIYGGFTHSGVGLLIMFGSFFLLGMDMLRANGIKQIAVAIYTPVALSIFIIAGQVHWGIAAIYSIGHIIGGIIGSYASIKGGEKLIKVFVAGVIFIMSGVLIAKQFR